MTVVWRSSSAGMLVPVAEHISAATLPVACVDSAPPVPGRAGKLRSSTDDAGARQRRGFSRNKNPNPAKHCQGLRLAAGLGGQWQQAEALASYKTRANFQPKSWFQLANIDRAFPYGTGYTFATAHRSTSSC